MIIITDTKEYTEEIFGFSPQWQKGILSAPLEKLALELFHSNKYFTAEKKHDPLWKYAFVVNHSKTSQFTSLIEFSNKAPDLPGGILCLAKSGDNFKGYRNRSWVTLTGNLHLSIYLEPSQSVDYFHVGFTILSALSVIRALDKIQGLKNKLSIKWVNDILIKNAKVAGVLTQTQTKGEKVSDLFIGIGINLKTTPQLTGDFIVKEAASIKDHVIDANKLDIASILNNLLDSLSENYKLLLKNRYKKILNAYIKRSKVIGEKIVVYSDPITGQPEKINQGKVLSIGKNLELFLEEKEKPVTRGRIIIE